MFDEKWFYKEVLNSIYGYMASGINSNSERRFIMGSITSRARDEQEMEAAVKKRWESFQDASRTLEKAYFDPRSVFILATSTTDCDELKVQAYSNENELLSTALGIISNILKESPEYKEQVFEELGIIGIDKLSDKVIKHAVLRSIESIAECLGLWKNHSKDTLGAIRVKESLEDTLDLLTEARETLDSRS